MAQPKAFSSPYNPFLTGRLAANRHSPAGASLWQCEKGSHYGLLLMGDAKGDGVSQVEEPAVWAGIPT
ncbi:MAG: hypothetical protein V7K18_08205 [Nostoc sp.]|uniref:hypothetical protein n=1 Tax=Nostoc sp. TaxID=1180 RepID=UPI002FF6B1B5